MTLNVENLKKIPKQPAARMLANANTKLETTLDLPVAAGVEECLAALDDQGASIDILRLLSVALPAREAVWWACLAAEDITGGEEENATPSLSAARAWVYKPDDENRAAVRIAMESADSDDDTVLCALAAYYADGTMGPGDLAEQAAPPTAVPGAVQAQNIVAMSVSAYPPEDAFDYLIRRGLDIARGGNGKVERPEPVEEVEDEE